MDELHAELAAFRTEKERLFGELRAALDDLRSLSEQHRAAIESRRQALGDWQAQQAAQPPLPPPPTPPQEPVPPDWLTPVMQRLDEIGALLGFSPLIPPEDV